MTTVDCITAVFCRIDAPMTGVPKHPQAALWPSEVVTLEVWHALTGVGHRACSRWLEKDDGPLFPRVPERTRRFRLFLTQQAWTQTFWAAPTLLGGIATSGIELLHPRRAGRSCRQIGRKGLSHHRWMVGGKLCLRLNQFGLVVAWACDTAHGHDSPFQPLMRQCEAQMSILGDLAFHAAEGDPANLKLCARGAWNARMRIETVLSMLTLVTHFKKMMPRVWEYFEARLAFTMAAFHVLVQWHGLPVDENGFVPLSIAKY